MLRRAPAKCLASKIEGVSTVPLKSAAHVPLATYRFQLNRDFAFSDLQRLAPYLAQLGISDCYCSPILMSAPGSSHGYDVNDYRKINPELGGEAGLEQLVNALRAHRLGILLDFVPNHMGIQGEFNEWWLDVLENGRSSPYAHFFDIRWNDHDRADGARVLVPVLEDHYGRMLEDGRIQLAYEDGTVSAVYGNFRFPLKPRSCSEILRRVARKPALTAATELDRIAAELASLPHPSSHDLPAAKERVRLAGELKRRLAALIASDAQLQAALQSELAEINGQSGAPGGFDALDRILDAQHYRLARWKAGVHEINYRRFFAVDSLAGLRMEREEVFRQSHSLIRQLLAAGMLAGLRIDHIDGLWDPLEYLQRLQELAKNAGATRGEETFYVVVEKILSPGESLPDVWPVHGTTGYEFIQEVANVLVDSFARDAIDATYQSFTGDTTNYADAVYRNKRLILEELFANAVINLAHSLAELVQEDRRWRDLTRHELVTAVRELIANLDVYRTYRRLGEPPSAPDRERIHAACQRALARNPRGDPEPFHFLRDLLAGDYPGPQSSPEYRDRVNRWVLMFQQYTGAVMAKSVEDTTYYTYCRFIALNEVGGEPSRFGAPVEEFHRASEARLADLPHSLVATSTHDTKLSEDVRARLYALSEIPDEWRAWLQRWHEINTPHRTLLNDRHAPDAVDEYRLYQVLLGAWPLDGSGTGDEFRQRIIEHTHKAINEAKRNTTWLHPNTAYIEAFDGFIEKILTPGSAFPEAFAPAAARIARLGFVNALAQLVLKCTVPGVPDFYQGNEIWDFSLVDPDNRRPVDFEKRQQLLNSAERAPLPELLVHWRDGRIKLRITQALLQLRQCHTALFQHGSYEALSASGNFAQHVIAFRREHEGRQIVVVVPRLASRLGTPPLGPVWDDTRLNLGPGGWRDALSGTTHREGRELPLAQILAVLPVAVLEKI